MVGDLVDSVVASEVSISDSTTRLDSISKTPPQWRVLASALGYALNVTSGSAKLMSGIVYLVKQIAGAWLGVGIAVAHGGILLGNTLSRPRVTL